MAQTNLPLDADRLWADVMALAEITDPQRPYTRRSFTALFLEGRAWLAEKFAEAGLATRIDAAGNLIGRLEGTNPALGAIAIGSHSDTVPCGGRFDGIAGVATGLEIVRAFRNSGIRAEHSIEIIDFLAEEPSEYGLSCVGSRGMTGLLDARMLSLTGPGGETLCDALGRVGGDPGRLDLARRDDIKAFLELHIEQGIVLESRSLDIGIVTSIVGIRRIEIIFQGEADHAGTTPLGLRHDALVAAAATVGSVRRLAEGLAAEGPDYFVATVGILTVEPSASNIVPGRARTRRRCANHRSGADPTFRRRPRSRDPGARRGRAGRARVVRNTIRWRPGCVRSRAAIRLARGRAGPWSWRNRSAQRRRP